MPLLVLSTHENICVYKYSLLKQINCIYLQNKILDAS